MTFQRSGNGDSADPKHLLSLFLFFERLRVSTVLAQYKQRNTQVTETTVEVLCKCPAVLQRLLQAVCLRQELGTNPLPPEELASQNSPVSISFEKYYFLVSA